jgi:ATP-dependent helicase/nuclease subunit A
MTTLAPDPSDAQRRAADPGASVWVAASAGTGKTKVLTDRVLSLLLAGTPAHRLLCLTFTKAAAAEMANRVNERLARWATASDADLTRDLIDLCGREADPAMLTVARRLFAQVLDAPGGMRIETIHAFCQSLLRRFPLEAGLAPHFQVMDDRDAGEMLTAAREEVLAAARDGDDPVLAQALAAVTAAVHETAFPDLMAELTSERGRLRRMILAHGSSAEAVLALRRRLGLMPEETAESILIAACRDQAFDAAGCRRAMAALAGGKSEDGKRAAAMDGWLADPAGRPAQFTRWRGAFLTAEGELRKRLCTKDVEAAAPGTLEILQTEGERLLALLDRMRAATVAAASAALLTLGEALLAAFERHKAGRAMLDYDDLILTTKDLLQQDGLSAWVLYKLDGGIDHVLIDEAQDTNPDQWAVIKALTDEFFAGRGRRDEGTRTVFAVGDAKQSIYSFQRADPREFETMRHRLADAVRHSEGRWTDVALQVSFRSTAAVLDAVDYVINSTGGRDGVVDPGGDVRHRAWRQGAAGLVEVWPPVTPRPADAPEPWKPPIERIRGDSPRGRLARLVALRIKAMLQNESLEARGRPIRPGDVMVLVRRRNAFVEELVRELKGLAVPVAGTDRMVLTEQLAVMDLMALGNALLLRDDDLTLATVLKGPLIGLTEEQLFELAWNRPASLWDALDARRADEPFATAHATLSRLMALADRVTPYDLYAHVLAQGGKARLLARLGPEAEDPLDEFVSLTLAYERLHPPSLQGFLRWLEQGGTQIKRDQEAGIDAVRIMTVHGSKGLQAPIVFLPDTLQAPTRPPRLLWLGETGREVLAWPPHAGDYDEVCRAARQTANQDRDQEYRRLLYVAMTRAEDRLYICGWQTQRAAPAHCWYNVIHDALGAVCNPVEDLFLAAQGETAATTVLRLDCRQETPPPSAVLVRKPPSITALPDWARHPAPAEPSPPRPLAPSRPDGEEPATRSPFGSDDGARFRRGRLIHRLLQSLPDLPPERRAAAAARFLARPAWGLSRAAQADVAAEIWAVLADPAWRTLFGPGSRAEVPIVGRLGDRVLSGQVDRLLVTADEVLVVDYKTNRPPPRRPEQVAPLYLRQMGAYRAALACIYPGRRIRCALLWTDGPTLMPLEGALLDDALAGLIGDAT